MWFFLIFNSKKRGGDILDILHILMQFAAGIGHIAAVGIITIAAISMVAR